MKINVKVIPNAAKNEIVLISENNYKIKVSSPPSDGKANTALIKLLADYFKVPKKAVNIKTGMSSRKKIIEINGNS